MVPEEQPVLQWDLLGPLQHQPRHLFKMTADWLDDIGTYLLPVGTLLGLTSWDLNAANQSSHGTAE